MVDKNGKSLGRVRLRLLWSTGFCVLEGIFFDNIAEVENFRIFLSGTLREIVEFGK